MGKSGGSGGLGGKGIQAALGYLGPTTQPRRQLFRQMASALATGGGKGFKMPFVQQAVARSNAAGKQALAGSSSILSGFDPAIRGRIQNRIARMQQQSAGAIAPRVAQQLASGAPAFTSGQGGAAASGMSIAGAGMEGAQRAAAIRAAGFSSLAQSLGGAAGTVAGSYAPSTVPGIASPEAIQVPSYSGGRPVSWFDRFRG